MVLNKALAPFETSTSIPYLPGPNNPETQPNVCISLLGEVRVWLQREETRIAVPIHSYRRQELLAYLATMAPTREHRVSSGRIITDVFEHIAPGSDVENLRGLFQKHTQLLRKELNEAAQQFQFPPISLFQFEKVDNSSTKWWLSPECRVVDLPAVRQAHRRLETFKESGSQDLEQMRAACEQVIALYREGGGDYLEKHLLQDDFGDTRWVREPFTEYREMYLQALWDGAVAEHNQLLAVISTPDRYRAAKKAAALYRSYALYAPKNRNFTISVKKTVRQSERALRGYLRICQWLLDAQAADTSYALYERQMRREFPEWKPEKTTIELLQTLRQQSSTSLQQGSVLPQFVEGEEHV